MADDDLRAWILGRVALLLDVAPSRISPERPLTEQGMDSVSAVALVGELEAELRRELDADLLHDHPTVDDLVALLDQGAGYRHS
ncbi:acyl carrier protein [Sciscionella sediminilitoris]|uniref:acyl carrier protein n=1 Tax=Sciscionella sediminilitoris TaxID=1445613 RepID=UPI0004DF09EA|nr:acyl carrier protein [Sciscionella sp. SE31]